jgi:hypothetical protein
VTCVKLIIRYKYQLLGTATYKSSELPQSFDAAQVALNASVQAGHMLGVFQFQKRA